MKKLNKCIAFLLVVLQLLSIVPARQVNAAEVNDTLTEGVVVNENDGISMGETIDATIEVASYDLRYKAVYSDGTPAADVYLAGEYTDADGYILKIDEFKIEATNLIYYNDLYVVGYEYGTGNGNVIFSPDDTYGALVSNDNINYSGKYISGVGLIEFNWVWEGFGNYQVGANEYGAITVNGYTFGGSFKPTGKVELTIELGDTADTADCTLEFDEDTNTYTIVKNIGDKPVDITNYKAAVNISNTYCYAGEYNNYYTATAFNQTFDIEAGITTVDFNIKDMLEAIETEAGGELSVLTARVSLPNLAYIYGNDSSVYIDLTTGTAIGDTTGNTYSFTFDKESGDAAFTLTYANGVQLGGGMTENESIARDMSEIDIYLIWEVRAATGVNVTVKYVDYLTNEEIAESETFTFDTVGQTSAVLDKEISGYKAGVATSTANVSLTYDKDTSGGFLYFDSSEGMTYYPASNFVAKYYREPASGVVNAVVYIKYFAVPKEYTVTVYQVFNNDYDNKVLYKTQLVQEGTAHVFYQNTVPVVEGYDYKGYTTYEILDTDYENLSKTDEFVSSGAVYSDTTIYLFYKSEDVKVEMADVTTRSATEGRNVIKWKASSNADGYIIMRKASKSGNWEEITDITDASILRYEDTDVVSRTRYYYTVKAYAKTDSGKVYAEYENDTTGVKTNIATVSLGTVTSEDGINTVTWTPVKNVAGYVIKRKTEGGKWITVGVVSGADRSSFADKKSLVAGTKYIYTIFAMGYKLDATDTYSKYGGFDKTGITVTATLKKVTLKTPSVTTGKVTVKWNKVSSADGYVVLRKVAGASDWSTLKTISGGTKTSYVDTTAKKGTKYVYTVRAYYKNSAGKTVSGSYDSTGKTVTAK